MASDRILSKALTETQRNYEIYDKEMLAIMLALEEWRHYLLAQQNPLKYGQITKTSSISANHRK